jgi:hypothetical protein
MHRLPLPRYFFPLESKAPRNTLFSTVLRNLIVFLHMFCCFAYVYSVKSQNAFSNNYVFPRKQISKRNCNRLKRAYFRGYLKKLKVESISTLAHPSVSFKQTVCKKGGLELKSFGVNGLRFYILVQFISNLSISSTTVKIICL